MSNADAIRRFAEMPREFIESYGDEGDVARRYLLNPLIDGLLGDVAGKTVLDAGCGTGYLARRLARRGATVIGVEPAAPMIAYAREREAAEPLGIRYLQADLSTLREPLLQADAVVANMVLMDIPDCEGALDSCLAQLRPGGSLICTLSHPCFEAGDREYEAAGAVTVSEYFAHYPIAQRWGERIHRPLSYYVNALIEREASIEAMVEPRLDPALAEAVPELLRHVHVPGFVALHAKRSAKAREA